MNRKNFINSCLTTVFAAPLFSFDSINTAFGEQKLPPYLKKGDCVGITSPAGYADKERLLPAVERLQEWGFKVKIGNAIGQRYFTFGGTDEVRAKDFQDMIDDPEVKAILCARGGYGFSRIIDRIDFTNFVKNPKWVIGFSDITVLHNHLNTQFGIASLHAKMCTSFPENWNTADGVHKATIESIRDAITGKKIEYQAPPSVFNRFGTVQAELVGGNLKIIESMAATPSDLKTDGKILFLEDVSEPLYNIDRMFGNLKRSGKLSKLAGLVVGGFKIKPDAPDEIFGIELTSIVLEQVKEFKYPVCFDFPVGHQMANFALKCGVMHELNVTEKGTTLKSLQ